MLYQFFFFFLLTRYLGLFEHLTNPRMVVSPSHSPGACWELFPAPGVPTGACFTSFSRVSFLLLMLTYKFWVNFLILHMVSDHVSKPGHWLRVGRLIKLISPLMSTLLAWSSSLPTHPIQIVIFVQALITSRMLIWSISQATHSLTHTTGLTALVCAPSIPPAHVSSLPPSPLPIHLSSFVLEL